MEKPDMHTYAVLVKGLCEAGQGEEVIQMLRRMKELGWRPSAHAYVAAVDFWCRERRVEEAEEMPTTVNYTIVIDKLFKEKNYGLATRIWGQMVSLGCSPDVVTYTTSMCAYCNEGRLIEAENVLMEMNKSGVTVDAMVYNTLIDGHTRIGQTDRAVSILKRMTSAASMPNLFTYLVLLRHLLQRRLAEDVPLNAAGVWKTIELTDIFELFDVMKKNGVLPNAGTYSAILEGFSEDGRSEEVTSLVSRMKEDNLSLTEDIYTALITSFCKSRMYPDAWALLRSMIRHGFVPHLMSYQHLLSGLTSEGQVDRATEIFGNSRWKDYNPDEIVWKVIIDGLIRKGHSDMCRDMISKLEQKNCRPSHQTYAMLTEELSSRD